MLKPVRRVVTGHDCKGQSIIQSDSVAQSTEVGNGQARFALLWSTDRSPADNGDTQDAARRPVGLTSPGGTVLRVVDFAPGTRSPMHRTSSVDYGIVLEGEIDLELDSGEVKHLSAGDVVVQRGTNHAWVSRSDRWARMAFVLIEAAPVRIGGVPLEPTHT
jgi:quercetin dioxygenase-like cupin family protein